VTVAARGWEVEADWVTGVGKGLEEVVRVAVAVRFKGSTVAGAAPQALATVAPVAGRVSRVVVADREVAEEEVPGVAVAVVEEEVVVEEGGGGKVNVKCRVSGVRL
jgi:hypothetical protein